MAEIQDVRLLRSVAELVRIPDAQPRLAYRLDSDAVVEQGDAAEPFVVRVTYALKIADASSDDDTDGDDVFDRPDTIVATIDFELAALFALDRPEDAEPATAEELEAYAVSTGQFAMSPLREGVHL